MRLECNVLLLCSYNLESGIWNTVPINSGPLPRYGHSLAAYQVNAHTPRFNFPCPKRETT